MPVTFNCKSEEVWGSTLDLINDDDKPKCGGTFQTSAWRTKAGAVFLGMLCLLLVLTFTLIAQSLRARSYWDQLHMSRLNSENLSSQWIQLQTNFNNLLESRNHLETKFKSLTEERDALRNETKQMKINANSLLDSRDQLQTNFNSLSKERDALRNQTEQLKINVNNLSESRDQLQTNYSSLTKERDALRNQTMQLKITADNMSESRGQLETELNSMTEQRDALRNETEQLKITAGNVSEEMKLLQSQYNSVAAARDALQSEVTELKRSVQLQLQLCKQQWVRFDSKCYYFSAKGEEKSWQNSKQDCIGRGGHLAIVTTKQVLDFISNFNVNRWIGLSDSVREGRWKWVDGTDLQGNGFWTKGEPNNAGNKEDCAHTHKSGNDPAGWNDNDCTLALSYVCQT
uniref:C-type lectin domain-containing protein n=1 Tax=Sphaeramia orbicularis TaxID=375764 RepID=A0A673CNH5_9TELE